MTRNVRRGTGLICFVWLCVASNLLVADPGAVRRPNIVLFFADDLGYGELGCQGNPEIPTPHIDAIARNGVRLTDGYVTASYCSASRAGLMSGRYQTRFGYDFNPIGAHNEDPSVGLPPAETTLAEYLHRAGYATALFGKWHLGGTAAYHPLRNGFDEFFGFLHEGHFYVPPPYRGVTTMLRRRALPSGEQGRWEEGSLVLSTHMGHDEPPYDANNPILRGSQPVNETAYLTDALTREAVDFIDRHQTRPFFLYLAYNAVHSPLQAADPYMRRFEHIEDIHRRIFAGMLSNLDDSVGSVMAKLRDSGLEENTLVFFISDNGGPTRELTSSNKPLRGGKGQVYEGGIRIPFLVQWKSVIPGSQVYRHPAISLDVYATAASVAGLPIPTGEKCDGVNLIPFLNGDNTEAPHDVLFWRMNARRALRCGNWKLVRQPGYGRSQAPWELYDLSADIAETKDLAADEPERLKDLTATWERLNREMKDPFWSPRR